MAERPKAAVLKTARGASPSRVRIPVPPLDPSHAEGSPRSGYATGAMSVPADTSRSRPTVHAVVLIFVGLAGGTAALTILFLSMRAVMRIGGFCASGGPYQIQTQCPKGVPGVADRFDLAGVDLPGP